MVHKQYLFQRNQNYYFRWRVPADLVPLVGLTEIRRSLHTLNRVEDSARPARLILVVNTLQQDKRALLALELDRETYVSRARENINVMREMGTRYFEYRMTIVKTADGAETTSVECKAGEGDPTEMQVSEPQVVADASSSPVAAGGREGAIVLTMFLLQVV